jgi:hypothetical protein
MSISIEQHARENGIIRRTYERVCETISEWGKRPDNAAAADGLAAWAGVDLAERMTVLVLHAQGYDPDLLDMALYAYPPDGWTLADLDAELERTRGKWSPPATGKGEGG